MAVLLMRVVHAPAYEAAVNFTGLDIIPSLFAPLFFFFHPFAFRPVLHTR
jgi:hypothetical protein